MDEDRELLLDGLDARAEAAFTVAKSGAVVVTGLPSGKVEAKSYARGSWRCCDRDRLIRSTEREPPAAEVY
jgi:hypothetical protein